MNAPLPSAPPTDTQRRRAAWPPHALPQGTNVNGYRIAKVLGQGGFGITYLADDLLEQSFAVKEFFPRQFAARAGTEVVASSDEDAAIFDDCRGRFLREAQALLRIGRLDDDASGIVRVQTFFEANGTAYMVMEYLQGESLENILRESGKPLPEPQLRALLTGVLSGLHLVHEAGLAHRDIKPANIVIRPDGSPVLIDFGSSRDIRTTQTSNFTQIFSGGYAPPEQMLGRRQARYSDLYAVGAVGYRCIGGSVVDALKREHAVGEGRPDPMPPAAVVGQGRYSPTLLSALDQALALDPTLRQQTALPMLALVGPAAIPEIDTDPSDTVIIAPRKSAAAPSGAASEHAVAAPSRHSRRWIALPVVLLLAAVVGGIYLTQQSGSKDDSRQHNADDDRQHLPPKPALQAAQALLAVPPGPVTISPIPAVAHGVAAILLAPTSTPIGLVHPVSPSRPVVGPPAPQAAIPAMPPVVQAFEPPQAPPAPSPVPTPLEQLVYLRVLALNLPCAAVAVRETNGGIIVNGVAATGPDVDGFVRTVRAIPHAAADITAIDSAFCSELEPVAALVRRAREAAADTILRIDRAKLAAGTHLAIQAQAPANRILLVDVYGPGNIVQHLVPQGARSGTASRIDWVAGGAPGTRLLVAITAARDLDIGTRPATEPATAYSAVLNRVLHDDDAANADVLQIGVTAPVTLPAKPTAAPGNSVRNGESPSPRCLRIMERVQLGEQPSDADLEALRGECRR